ncbi:MAG TPA: hypothetical protein VE993_16865 [Stellaceae bacterium]|nr:hypothetical protein [Stellaceae bacterium]
MRMLFALALVLLMAGCVASATSDKDRQRGFYGGVSAGGAVP